jgi:tRNA-specific 2-thiouridylase
LKATALFSGGLDSVLSIKLIQEQNIDIEAVYIDLGFESNKNKTAYLQQTAKQLGIPLTVLDKKEEYIKTVLFEPKYGYGKNFNPCIDCHAFMIKKAKEYMEEIKADFIISGEVVGQRPMSQRLPALNTVNRLSNAQGLVLRPLSAKLLPPTVPEIKGWVDREKLLDISGRDRKTQIELAKKYNLENLESPGGGCLLTDINFSKRLKDFSKTLQLTPDEIDILKIGRHFNVEGFKIIISRKAEENPYIQEYKGNVFDKMHTKGFPGPAGLIQKNAPSEIKQLAADMMVSYTRENSGEIVINSETFHAKKHDKSEFAKYLV